MEEKEGIDREMIEIRDREREEMKTARGDMG